MQRLQRLTAEAGEWAREYRARQRAAAPAAPSHQLLSQQQLQSALRHYREGPSDALIVPSQPSQPIAQPLSNQQLLAAVRQGTESPSDAPVAALAAYNQSGGHSRVTKPPVRYQLVICNQTHLWYWMAA